MRTRRSRRLAIAAACTATLAGSVLWADTAGATPSSRAQGEFLADVTVAKPVQISTDKPSELQLVKLTILPGGSTGWHSHDASVLVAVEKGTATFYDGDDPQCTPHRFHAGTGTPETPRHVHTVRNEGHKPLVLDVVLVVPTGGSDSVDQSRPGNCPF